MAGFIMKKETALGLILLAAFLVANQFTSLPHLLLGGMIGLACCFLLIGGLPEKRYNTVKSFKQKVYQKVHKK